MKILIFNTLYYPNQIGGAEKSVQLLAEGLLQKGIEPVIVTTSNKNYVNYINGVKVYYVKTTNLYWSYNAKEENKLKKPLWHLIDSYNLFNKKIGNIFDDEKSDIVHTNNLAGFSVSVWKLAKQRNIKLVHTLRDYYLLCPKSTMYNDKLNKPCAQQCLSCNLYSIPKKTMSKYVNGLVGISKFILNKHIENGYFKNAKKTIIFNPVDDVAKNLQVLKKEKNDILFGFVGRLEKAKGIEFLLKNFPSDNTLYIYGSGEKNYVEYLKQKFKNKNIVFKGYTKPQNIYTTIDILIVPSLWNEPFGRIVPEANSYGIPVLVNNRGGLSELVENGKNGYIFDSDKKGDFKEKLFLIQKLYNSKNMVFDNKSFTKNYIVEQYVEFYRDVLC